MKEINMDSWGRKEIFDFFSTVSNPFYMVTFRLDVTELYRYVKANGLSFYYSLIYLCTKALCSVPEFMYVIRGGMVTELDGRIPSFTDLRRGSDCFHIVTMPSEGTMHDFCRAAAERSAAQKGFIDYSSQSDGLIYFSCLPWVDMTALTNERDLAAPGARDDSVPHIAWGKYVKNGDRLELGVSVEVNHRLIDGVHIGKFAAELEHLIRSL